MAEEGWRARSANADRLPPAGRLATLLLAAGGGLTAVLAQPFHIPWSTVDGGGGVSAGGAFTVRGTIGQPDAGRMSGGGFMVTGGFQAWPQVIQTPGAPGLSITHVAAGQVVVSWAPAAGGWLLQEAAAVNGPWTPVAGGGASPVTVPAAFPVKFYRLARP